MNEDVLQRLESSFGALKPQGAELVEAFYNKLFADHPEVRKMFPDEMKDQRKKLLQSLAFVVANLRNPDALSGKLKELGAGHLKYGTTAEHYSIVRDCLLSVMADTAGDLWNDQLQDDWITAINAVAGIMLEGAAEAE